MTSISLGILLVLHEHKEIKGTATLARLLNADPRDVRTNGLLLSKYGLINMVIDPNHPNGGRGYGTIYRDAGVIKVQR